MNIEFSKHVHWMLYWKPRLSAAKERESKSDLVFQKLLSYPENYHLWLTKTKRKEAIKELYWLNKGLKKEKHRTWSRNAIKKKIKSLANTFKLIMEQLSHRYPKTRGCKPRENEISGLHFTGTGEGIIERDIETTLHAVLGTNIAFVNQLIQWSINLTMDIKYTDVGEPEI